MSETHDRPDPGDEDLQFDRADFKGSAGEGAACAACSGAIEETYFEVNGVVHCATCSDGIQAYLNRPPGLVRPLKALLFGLICAAIGSGIYFAILKLTGYEIGLVAIVVGFLVGFGVKKGSEDRGGLGYQVLAVVLTYGAIVSTYIPLILIEIQNQMDAMERSAIVKEEGGNQEKAGTQPREQPQSSETPPPPTLKEVLMAYGFLFFFAVQAPFHDMGENIIGLLIIGFALYQAWVITRKVEVKITGPYEIGSGGEET